MRIVLAARALARHALLLQRPASRSAGMLQVAPVADLPGVGAAFRRSPPRVEWMRTSRCSCSRPASRARHGAFPVALRIGADGGARDALEILACTQPPSPEPDARTLGLIVGLQRPARAGRCVRHPLTRSPHPRSRTRYLEDRADRAALRLGVRHAAGILAAPAFAGLVEELADLDPATLDDDALLDAWIALHLSSAARYVRHRADGRCRTTSTVGRTAGRSGVPGLHYAGVHARRALVRAVAAVMAVGAIVADQM